MTTIIIQENGIMMAKLAGELDTAAVVQVEKDLQPIMESDMDVILDCEQLTYISSSGLRLFLSVLKNQKAKDKNVSIINLNTDLRRIFDMTGFNKLFGLE
ncbi:MAG: STAS domain-containing protein [Bacteroidales bacterium]|nr:STAS domain-containing protein [Bacteroidales bacterium]MBO7648020.1 STAS domain-containing protein [Bacteroidales bacterium]